MSNTAKNFSRAPLQKKIPENHIFIVKSSNFFTGRIYCKMKKIAGWMLFLAGGLLLPIVCTMLISGRTGGDEQKMGITVLLKDGTKIDGERFVIGMAALGSSCVKEEEALKAWMIVCRTNFVKAAGDGRETVKEKDLSLDYVSMESLEENNGRKTYLELKKKLEDASEDTFGEALYYKGKYIDALYHEVSIGKTVSSEEIYNVPVAYLVSVDSSQDVESDDYMQVKSFAYEECVEKLKKAGSTVTAKGLKKKLVIAAHTENGFVEKVTAGKNEWTGEEWKKIFSLNSTNFYLENYKGRLRIVTIGKGHNMGMSLYGANALAGKELLYETILSHYYPGTGIGQIK